MIDSRETARLREQADYAEGMIEGILFTFYPELSDPGTRERVRKRIHDDALSIQPNEHGVFKAPIEVSGAEFPDRATLERHLLVKFCQYMAREMRKKNRGDQPRE